MAEFIVGIVICVAGVILLLFAVVFDPEDSLGIKNTKEWRKYQLEVMKTKEQYCVNCAHYREEFKTCVREEKKINWDPVLGIENVENKTKTYNCRSIVGSNLCSWQAIVRENDSV